MNLTKRSDSPKLLPWFVSDVLPTDFLFQLSPPSPASDSAPADTTTTSTTPPSWSAFFASSYPSPTPVELEAMDTMMHRWRSYLASGVFSLSVSPESGLGVPPASGVSEEEKNRSDAAFWTTLYSYWKLPEQERLLKDLQASGLVIFKGDLKYVFSPRRVVPTSD